MKRAFRAGEFTTDTVVVVQFQGPEGQRDARVAQPDPVLAVLQDRGLRVALVTDGRMSGASGKVPSAIHVSPEALDGGPLARLRDGDLVRVDATAGTLDDADAGRARPAGGASRPLGQRLPGWGANSLRRSRAHVVARGRASPLF